MKGRRAEPLRSLQALARLRDRLPSAAAAQPAAAAGTASKARKPPPEATGAGPALAPPQPALTPVAEDPRALFVRAVADVRPEAPAEIVPRHGRRRDPPPLPDPASQVVAELNALVTGRAAFDLSLTDEHLEGIAQGIDRRWLRRLRRGELAVEAHLDLHGATRQEAKVRLEQFLLESRRRGRRCVLIVHGRGLHSRDGVPVLKEQLRSWLLHGRIGQSTMAFCSARGSDGGLGALYLLLRR